MSTFDNFWRSLGSIDHILVSENQPDFILPVSTCLRNPNTEIILGSIIFHFIKVAVTVILQKKQRPKENLAAENFGLPSWQLLDSSEQKYL